MRSHGRAGGGEEGRAGAAAGEDGQTGRRDRFLFQRHPRRRQPPAARVEYRDSPELYAQDILRRNNNESDADLTKRLTETSGRVADFLTDMAGIEFQIGEFAFGHSAQRSHSWKADKTITDFLFEAVEREKNIQV